MQGIQGYTRFHPVALCSPNTLVYLPPYKVYKMAKVIHTYPLQSIMYAVYYIQLPFKIISKLTK